MNAKEGEYVDHISHNVQDTRRCNLRKTTNARNSQNRKGANKNCKTGVRNVHWIKKENCYYVQIMKDGVSYKEKFQPSKFKEACEFAKNKRNELFGEYAGVS
jgi:hypothetical protein